MKNQKNTCRGLKKNTQNRTENERMPCMDFDKKKRPKLKNLAVNK